MRAQHVSREASRWVLPATACRFKYRVSRCSLWALGRIQSVISPRRSTPLVRNCAILAVLLLSPVCVAFRYCLSVFYLEGRWADPLLQFQLTCRYWHAACYPLVPLTHWP